MKKEIPDDLIIKNLTGESSPEEDRLLWEWVDYDDENQKIFSDAIKLYGNKDELISKHEIESRLGKMNLYTVQPMPVSWKIAASLLLICIFAAAIVLLDDRVIEKTSFGTTRQITLPDQSHVWLNGGTTIAFNRNDFSKTRKVLVEGEAYFEVVAGISPFVITYDSVEASLDSGEVNIQTYPHELEKIAIVSKGSVTFRDVRKGLKEIIASTDHEIISRSDYGLLARSINTNVNFKSWVTGIYVFNDEPIERVISVVGKGDPNIKFTTDDGDRDRLVSGVFKLNASRKSKEEIIQLIDRQQIFWK